MVADKAGYYFGEIGSADLFEIVAHPAVRPGERDQAIEVLTAQPLCRQAAIIGSTSVSRSPRVVLQTVLGTDRVIDLLSGEQLPRIC